MYKLLSLDISFKTQEIRGLTL